MKRRVWQLLCVVTFVGCHRPAPPPPAADLVGLASRTLVDPVGGGPMKVAIFFPPAQRLTGAAQRLGLWWVEAGDARPAPGARPLILISHGHGGSRFGHHDLAVALARAGNVVATVDHVGDSSADQSGVGTERVLLGRAWQISAALDALLAEAERWSIDRRRVGVAGFSAGGYTSLLVVGAQPDFTRITGYCTRHPDDRELCSGAPRVVTEGARDTMDPRVGAAFVMAPLGVFFGPDAFRRVRAPVALTWAQRDTVLLPEENAAPVQRGLATLTSSTELPNADHYVFIAPCTEVPLICTDPPGVDRARVHADLATAAVKFFADALPPPAE